MKILYAYALMLALLPAFASSASAQSSGPEIDRILARYVEAVGGQKALEKLKSRVMKCELKSAAAGNMTMKFEITAQAPNRRLTIMEIPGIATIREGYDGETGWAEVPMGGVQQKSGEELEKLKRECRFPRELALRQLYPRMTLKGTQRVGPRQAHVIEMQPPTGKPEVLYFDVRTGLLLRTDQEQVTPQGSVPTEIYYEDYRQVDGFQIPFTVRVPKPEQYGFTLKVLEVKHNVDLADDLFKKPR